MGSFKCLLYVLVLCTIIYIHLFLPQEAIWCVCDELAWKHQRKKGTWFLVSYFSLFLSLWLFFFVGIFAWAVLVMRGVGSLSYWEKHWANIRECALLQPIVIKSDPRIFMSQLRKIRKYIKSFNILYEKIKKKIYMNIGYTCCK